MGSTSTTEPRNKLLGIEMLRFMSALAVLLWHYQHFYYVDYKPTNFTRESQPLYSLFSFLYNNGHYGVQIFWCISGFIFFKIYYETISQKNISAREFIILRFSRLYPLHICTLILVLILQNLYKHLNGYYFVYANNSPSDFLLQIFLASNWGIKDGFSFNGPIWSVSTEILVYIAYFTILRYITKSTLVNIAFIAIYLIAKYLKASSLVFDCLAYFYIGGLAAIWQPKIQSSKYRKHIELLIISILLITPAVTMAAGLHKSRYFPPAFLLFYTPLLIIMLAKDFNTSKKIQEFCQAAGNITYASYLIHFPLQLAIATAITAFNLQTLRPHNPVFLLAYLLTTITLSRIVYKKFEMPSQNFLRRKLI